MHLANLEIPAVLLLVMLGAFAVVDRYAARHPYGTGRFGEMERKRRAKEAQRRGIEERNRQGRQSNEAAMPDIRARLETGAKDGSNTNAGAEDDSDRPQGDGRER
jgi:hypothetical protein